LGQLCACICAFTCMPKKTKIVVLLVGLPDVSVLGMC